MRKIGTAIVLALTLVFATAPFATAVNNLEPCPRFATMTSLRVGCELPPYPEEAEPVVGYYSSAVIVMQNAYVQALGQIAEQRATITQQADKIERKRAKIRLLRERLSSR